MKKNNLLLYVFGNGRKKRIEKNYLDSKEFFYGYFHFLEEYKHIEIIEMLPNEIDVRGLNRLLDLIDKVLRKLSNLPFFFHLITSPINFKKIFLYKNIFATNDRLGLSILPMYIFSKLFKKKNFSVIVMGLFGKPRNNFVVKNIQFFFLKIYLKTADNFVFLGQGEYNLALNLFPKYSYKFHFIPFGLNLNFWKSELNNDIENKDYILFVGNDGNRDFKELINIVNSNQAQNFVLVTNQVNKSDFLFDNVKIYSGSWNNQVLTDDQLKKVYQNAKITIIPLKNSLQPSGQSVCLQSMSVGTPVIISETKGFWDIGNFKNKENIFFVKDNWSSEINKIINNSDILKRVSKNGLITVKKYYDEKIFINKLSKIIIHQD